jgi:hypothetical protein
MKVRTLVSTAILATAALAGASSSQAQSHRPLRGTTVAAADRVPTFDTRPSCADAASDISATRTTTSCQQSEQQARDTLMSRWQSFPAADKRNCVAGTNVGGFPSYVQVLVCLELARDARAIKTN